jgi:hypothetical protein
MKAILEFNLPEDQTEYQMVNDASKIFSVIWDMNQWLRKKTKYCADNTNEDTYEAFEECREKLNELLADNRVDLDI